VSVLAAAAVIALFIGSRDTIPNALPAQRDVVLSAAFVFNFAKFTDWPGLAGGAPIVACVYGDDGIAAALAETVRGQNINGHPVEVRSTKDESRFRLCQLVFVGAAETRRWQAALAGISALPVLTVSDGAAFALSGGIIEMYVEEGRMRFAINVTAVERSGLHLSPHLLGLARIVRSLHVP
jgi:hypothetical protein